MRSTRPGKLSSSQDFSIGRSISLTRSSSVRALLLSTVWARELKADSTAETVDCARIGCCGGNGGASKSTGAYDGDGDGVGRGGGASLNSRSSRGSTLRKLGGGEAGVGSGSTAISSVNSSTS